MENKILFYGRTKPDPKYWPFSNFHCSPFMDSAGTKWKTTEHYFQAMKFLPESMIKFERPRDTIEVPIREWINTQRTLA